MKKVLTVAALLAAVAVADAGNHCASVGACYQQQAVAVASYQATVAVPVYQPAQVAVDYCPPAAVATPYYQRQAFAAVPVYGHAAVAVQSYYQPAAFVRQRAFVNTGYGGYGGSAFVGGGQFRGPPIVRGGFGGGRFSGPVAQGFQTGGLLGAAERLTGLGNGSGDFGRGAIIGVLGARSNLFGLGRR